MKFRVWIVVALVGLFVPIAAQAQEEVTVKGRVVDAAGKPVVGADVASFWNVEKGKMQPYNAATTKEGGQFILTFMSYGQVQGFLAVDTDRKHGGLCVVDPKDAKKPIEIKLAPLVHVHGKFECKELGKRPTWTNVYMMSGQSRFLSCSSQEAEFSFYLPPGTYKFWGYGSDIQDYRKDITVEADKPDLDLKTIDMAATIIARHRGKAPPAWHVTDARGVKKEVKLSDFKGKWVFVEFWGFW
jgi:hypothetical protein